MTALAGSLGAAVSARVQRWARNRQGTDPASTHLAARRIYILPTRAGLIFGFIVFTMLLGAMNYNNNMGFVLTFLLAGIGVISIHHCHRNLADLYLHFLGAHPVFAGDDLLFLVVIENRSRVSRWQIRLAWDDNSTVCNELQAESRERIALCVRTSTRGYVPVPRIQLSTRFPLGLLRAWAWVNIDDRELVYPAPERRASGDHFGHSGHTTSGYDRGGDDDFSGLRDYRLGDPPRHIAWKALARTGETLVTEYRSGTRDLVWIDWKDFPGTATEARLAALARKVLDTDGAGHRYGLRMPAREIRPATGAAHRHECLKALALFGPTTGGRVRDEDDRT
ncbi:MAG: DUF58 domain-containing protein [Gammaproteobacteria bacterium]